MNVKDLVVCLVLIASQSVLCNENITSISNGNTTSISLNTSSIIAPSNITLTHNSTINLTISKPNVTITNLKSTNSTIKPTNTLLARNKSITPTSQSQLNKTLKTITKTNQTRTKQVTKTQTVTSNTTRLAKNITTTKKSSIVSVKNVTKTNNRTLSKLPALAGRNISNRNKTTISKTKVPVSVANKTISNTKVPVSITNKTKTSTIKRTLNATKSNIPKPVLLNTTKTVNKTKITPTLTTTKKTIVKPSNITKAPVNVSNSKNTSHVTEVIKQPLPVANQSTSVVNKPQNATGPQPNKTVQNAHVPSNLNINTTKPIPTTPSSVSSNTETQQKTKDEIKPEIKKFEKVIPKKQEPTIQTETDNESENKKLERSERLRGLDWSRFRNSNRKKLKEIEKEADKELTDNDEGKPVRKRMGGIDPEKRAIFERIRSRRNSTFGQLRTANTFSIRRKRSGLLEGDDEKRTLTRLRLRRGADVGENRFSSKTEENEDSDVQEQRSSRSTNRRKETNFTPQNVEENVENKNKETQVKSNVDENIGVDLIKDSDNSGFRKAIIATSIPALIIPLAVVYWRHKKLQEEIKAQQKIDQAKQLQRMSADFS